MWAKRVVQSLLSGRGKEAVELAEAKDQDYDAVKRRLARVEARLNILLAEGDLPLRKGEPDNARDQPYSKRS